MFRTFWGIVKRDGKTVNLSREDSRNLYDLGELYHDFSIFGFKTKQPPGIFGPNQRCKAPIINAYIQLAIAKSKSSMSDTVTFAELFCADGYYAMVARLFGAMKSYGIDRDEQWLEKARKIADKIGLTNIEFVKEDVNNIDRLERVDVVANVGGLYHVPNPEEILTKSYNMAKKYLIVQSVVSMANDSPDYFETPAPGWTWGCRFNKVSFQKMIERLGYEVVDYHFNELEGNDRLEDRGSVYYLIKVK
ncbi:MAG: methyltransferase domain-containing protein [Moorellaceae bacterium]